MKGIPHHLLDVVSPKNKFTVAEYKKLAEEKIKEIICSRKNSDYLRRHWILY